MKPLRIAMVCDMVPGQPGGSYISTMRFAELLNARGHHVVIIGAKDSRQTAVPFYKNTRIYQFFSLPMPGSHRYYFYAFPSKRALKKIFIDEKIDIVHCMFPSYSCFVATRLAKKMNLPVVTHSHTQPENMLIFMPKFLQTSWMNTLLLDYLDWFFKPAKVVLSPSTMGAKIITDFNPKLHVEVVSNGIDLEKFHSVPTDEFLAKYTLSKENRYLLCVARFTMEKEVETLVRAMSAIVATHPNARLLLIGTGPLRASLEGLCTELSISERVHFLGKISDEDLLGAFNACEIFILPSLVELEGMVVLEAMACKKPIIIADSPTSASRYFVKENGFLFTPKDPDDLARKANAILVDDALRARMSEESFTDAKTYDINVSVEKLERIYESVLA